MTFEELARFLRESGESEDLIAVAIEEITKQAGEMFYKQALASLTEEDLKYLDTVTDENTANQVISEGYAEATGKPADETMKELLEKSADAFVQQYKKNKAEAENPATPVSAA